MRDGRGEGRGQRRRGAALVIVMIFGVGALMLVTTLLAMTERGAKMSAEMGRHKNLQAVLKAGIAASLNEMTRTKLTGTEYDPGDDGNGAITRTATGTANDGVPVIVTTTAGPMTIGYYRTTIRKVGAKNILVCVAAWPSFDAPADRRVLAAAEMEVVVAPPHGDFNPIQVVGAIDADNVDITVSGGSKLNVTGIDNNPSGATNPTQANVPAANIDTTNDGGGATDDFIDPFKTDFVAGATTFTGAAASGSGTASGNGTVTQNTSNAFNDTTLSTARATYHTQVATILGGTYTSVASGTFDGGGAGATLGAAGGTTVISGAITLKGKVSGSGTLVIRDKLVLDNGCDFDWDGDIIIAGYNTASPYTINQNAEYNSKPGASLDLEGKMVILGNTVKLIEGSGNAGGSVIDGALLMLGNDNNTAEISVDGGSELLVEGITAIYSETVNVLAKGGSDLDMRSLNVVFTDANDDDNKFKFEASGGSQIDLLYDNTSVTGAMSGLWTYLGELQNQPLVADAYWEKDPLSLLVQQQAQITGATQSPANLTGFGTVYTGDWGK